MEVKSAPYTTYDQVPWYRKNWFVIISWVVFFPIALIVMWTGDVYYVRKGLVTTYTKTSKILLTIIAVVSGYYGYYSIANQSLYTASGLPKCDSDRARSDVNDAIANAPLGRVQGISVIDYRNIVTEENTSTVVRCKANAVLNTDTTKPVYYSFTVEGDKVMVRFKIGD
jgi:hypothetical protein